MNESTSLEFELNPLDLLLGICDAVDLMDPSLAGHQLRVAYIAHSLGRESNLETSRLRLLLMAGMLHDIGALSLPERESLEVFEAPAEKHCEIGYLFLRRFPFFLETANAVRFHHQHWLGGEGSRRFDSDVPAESHLLHLADRIDILVSHHEIVESRKQLVMQSLDEHSGTMFVPEHVEAFRSLSRREAFWFSLGSRDLDRILRREVNLPPVRMNIDDLESFAQMFSGMIDFRSRFTSTHSAGVAHCAQALASRCGFSPYGARLMKVAGYLHDLGKLGVPVELLEKEETLDPAEFDVIKKHPFITYNVLMTIRGLDEVAEWAAYHHERPDGSGYPFRKQDGHLSIGARIMAVADVFVALMEDRPYRKGVALESALAMLKDMVSSGAMDGRIVNELEAHLESIDSTRIHFQSLAKLEYEAFVSGVTEAIARHARTPSGGHRRPASFRSPHRSIP